MNQRFKIQTSQIKVLHLSLYLHIILIFPNFTACTLDKYFMDQNGYLINIKISHIQEAIEIGIKYFIKLKKSKSVSISLIYTFIDFLSTSLQLRHRYSRNNNTSKYLKWISDLAKPSNLHTRGKRCDH